MKLTGSIEQKELKRALDLVSMVKGRSTLPIFATTKIAVSHNTMVLQTTNSEIESSVTIDCAHEGTWAGCVNTKGLLSAVKGYDAGRIEFAVPDEDDKLVLEQDGGIADFRTWADTEFPPRMNEERADQEKHVATIGREQLIDTINRTSDTWATDDSRPVLTGALVEIGSTLRVASADGFHLSVHTTKKLPTGAKPKLTREKKAPIVPGSALALLKRMTNRKSAGDPVVHLDRQGKYVRFLWQDVKLHASLTVALVQGTFPDYQKLIPAETATHFKLDIDDVSKRIKQVVELADEGAGILRIELAPESVNFSARVEEVGSRQAKYETDVEIGTNSNGDPLDKVALNTEFVKELLKTYKGETVGVGMTTASSPVVVTRADSIGETTVVIMPMFVQW